MNGLGGNHPTPREWDGHVVRGNTFRVKEGEDAQADRRILANMLGSLDPNESVLVTYRGYPDCHYQFEFDHEVTFDEFAFSSPEEWEEFKKCATKVESTDDTGPM